MPAPSPSAWPSLLRGTRRADQFSLATALLRSGFTPFLALFLCERGLGPGAIGAILGALGAVRLAATLPAGMLVDRARGRSRWPIVAALLTLGASLLLLLLHAQGIAMLLCAGALMAISEAMIAPALLVMNLDEVATGASLNEIGRNQAYGHAGRIAGLAMSGVIGQHFGVSALIAFEISCLALLLPLAWRTPVAARAPAPARDLLRNPDPSLLLLGIALGLFQIGNAALPTLLGLSLVDTTPFSTPVLASGTTIIAQLAMIAGSLLVIPTLRCWNYWPVLAASFALLPLRCMLAALLPAPLALGPVELLHGIGEGAQMVAIGGLIGDLHRASGRAGTRFGWVMLIQGVGSAVSPLIGGYVAERWTSAAAYALLGVAGSFALAFWILCRAHLTRFTARGRLGLA